MSIKAKIAAEKLRAQVAGLQESNDKYKEVRKKLAIKMETRYNNIPKCHHIHDLLQDLSVATEELRRLQSERDKQMVEQLAQQREEIHRLSRQLEAREEEIQWKRN